MKQEYDLTNKELIKEMRGFPTGIMENKSFIRLKGKDYLLVNIEIALIKGVGVNSIK